MKILAFDFGKFNTVSCDYQSETEQHTFDTLKTCPATFRMVIQKYTPDVVVSARIRRFRCMLLLSSLAA